MRECTLDIESLAYGGAGFGRVQGKACFTPFTAPGDQALVKIQRETASYLTTELVRLIKNSPDRVTPPCPVFGNCGGCQWQHLRYDVQSSAKEQIFCEALWRLARLERDKILPIDSTESPWNYRSRVQFKIHGRSGAVQMGFFAAGTHYVVDAADRCFIADPAITMAAAGIRSVLNEFPERDQVPQVDVAIGDDGAVVMTLHYLGSHAQATSEFWSTRHERLGPVTGICLQQGRKSTLLDVWGDPRLSYHVPGSLVDADQRMLLSFSAGSFSQVNYRMNAELVRTVLEWSNLSGSERVLDLCCGNGNFSVPLARFAREVVGLETNESSVVDARINAVYNGVTTARFTVQDSAAGLRSFLEQGENFDVIVLDPPRSGAVEMTDLITQMGPDRIIYVSCDPQTLGRDLARLQKGGYQVMRSRPFDLFPQTYHVESVTLLQRN